MQEIKFRAIFDGKIIEYVKWQDGNWMYSEDQIIWYFEKKYAHTYLQQFTGLKDKNGKEIYEGDVVQIRDGNKIAIRWSDNITNCGECSEVQATGFDLQEFCNAEEREVIGNIYENPDLLN